MRKWNPFGKVDMEIGSFLKTSRFNKSYGENNEGNNEENKENGMIRKNGNATSGREGK